MIDEKKLLAPTEQMIRAGVVTLCLKPMYVKPTFDYVDDQEDKSVDVSRYVDTRSLVEKIFKAMIKEAGN